MIWLVGAVALFLLLAWVGRQVRLGKFKTGAWFHKFRAVRGVIGFALMALAIAQMARGAWAVGLVLAVLSLLVSSSVRFAAPFRSPEPHAASAFTPEEVQAYQTLQLTVGADRRAVKEAWKRLMKDAHPDQGGDVKRASALNAARDLLLRRR